MESFSFHFVFLGKAKLSEVVLKLASAQTRSESAKAAPRNIKQKSLLIGSNENHFNLIFIVDAKKSIMVMGRYTRR